MSPENGDYAEIFRESFSGLNEAEARDLRSLLNTVGDLDAVLASPDEAMGVESQALREFVELTMSRILHVVMSDPGGEQVLMPMALVTGMMIGYRLSEDHAKAAESQEGVTYLERGAGGPITKEEIEYFAAQEDDDDD